MYKFFAALIVILLMTSCLFATRDLNRENRTVQIVRDAERICTGGEYNSCKYLVYTSSGVFQNTDSLMHGKFNSSDLHQRFVEGAQCRITTVWFRVRFLSMYPNIIQARCINNPD